MKQKLILITGSPCVGKTTVAERLFETCEDSAYFDGDWAWRVNPFSLSDPRLRNGDKTMSFALSNYLRSGFAYVIFSSVVIIGAEIREAILRVYDGRLYADMLGGDACRAAPPARRQDFALVPMAADAALPRRPRPRYRRQNARATRRGNQAHCGHGGIKQKSFFKGDALHRSASLACNRKKKRFFCNRTARGSAFPGR